MNDALRAVPPVEADLCRELQLAEGATPAVPVAEGTLSPALNVRGIESGRVTRGHRFMSTCDIILATVRAGLVILFCSHWTGYEAVFYKTAIEGPAELSATLLGPTGLPVLTPTVAAGRLESAYDALRDQTNVVQSVPPGAPAAPQKTQVSVGGGRIAEMRVVTYTGVTKTTNDGMWSAKEIGEAMKPGSILMPE